VSVLKKATPAALAALAAAACALNPATGMFLVAGLAPAQAFNQADADFPPALRSFRPLPAAQAAEIRPNRIDLYTAREGDTWASIAERPGTGIVKASTLAIMNGRAPNDQPRPGDRLKIGVAG
jgi:predicted Zn-dependent protease